MPDNLTDTAPVPATPAVAATPEPAAVATPADAPAAPTPDIAGVVSAEQETLAREQALRATQVGGATVAVADPVTGELPPLQQTDPTPSLEERPDVHRARPDGEPIVRTRIVRHKKPAGVAPIAKKEVK